jgi:hypothetical protein
MQQKTRYNYNPSTNFFYPAPENLLSKFVDETKRLEIEEDLKSAKLLKSAPPTARLVCKFENNRGQ